MNRGREYERREEGKGRREAGGEATPYGAAKEALAAG